MNKEDLVNTMTESTGMSKKEINLFLDAFLDTINTSLSEGEKVSLIRFGSWNIQNVAAHTGRNPRTGEAISIKAKKKVRFKAGAELSASVN